jgi:hypothetical protein
MRVCAIGEAKSFSSCLNTLWVSNGFDRRDGAWSSILGTSALILLGDMIVRWVDLYLSFGSSDVAGRDERVGGGGGGGRSVDDNDAEALEEGFWEGGELDSDLLAAGEYG